MKISYAHTLPITIPRIHALQYPMMISLVVVSRIPEQNLYLGVLGLYRVMEQDHMLLEVREGHTVRLLG